MIKAEKRLSLPVQDTLKWQLADKDLSNEFEVLTYYSQDKINWERITNNDNADILQRVYDVNMKLGSVYGNRSRSCYIVLSDHSLQFPYGMKLFIVLQNYPY